MTSLLGLDTDGSLVVLGHGELLQDVSGHVQVIPSDAQGPDDPGLGKALRAELTNVVHVQVLVGDHAVQGQGRVSLPANKHDRVLRGCVAKLWALIIIK